MTNFHVEGGREGQGRGWAWIADHNPLFLLSAALMLLGCYLLSTALEVRAGEIGKLLLLLGTLNVYEFLLIGLGIFLWRKGVVRDGMLLLMIEGLFLADLTFLNSEAAATGLARGAIINGVLLILGLAKLGLVIWKLPLQRNWRTLGFVPLVMVMLCGLPVMLKGISIAGEVGPRPLYAMWWIAGMMLVAFDLVSRWRDGGSRSPVAPVGDVRIAVRGVWMMLPWIGLVAHLGFSHYVYEATFHFAALAPVLIGLMVIAPRVVRLEGELLVAVRLLLGFLTLMAAISNPPELALSVPKTAAGISPAMMTIGALTMAAAYVTSLRSMMWAAIACGILAALRLWGPSISSILNAIERTLRWMRETAGDLLPRTMGQWGVVAVIGAFVALGLGLLVSLRKKTHE